MSKIASYRRRPKKAPATPAKRARLTLAITLLVTTAVFVISTNAMQPQRTEAPAVAGNTAATGSDAIGPAAQQQAAIPATVPVPQQREEHKLTLLTQPPEAAPIMEPAADDANESSEKPAPNEQVHRYTVKKNDTISHILDRFGLFSAMQQLLALDKKERNLLTRLLPGRVIELKTTASELKEIVYQSSPIERVILSRRDDGRYQLEKKTLEVEKREAYATGEIVNSLYLAAGKSGLSDKLTVEMANILGWDIDFAYDIRRGDRFALIYEEHYLDGEKFRDGSIIAVEFVNRGKTHRFIRYIDSKGNKGYFSESGKNAQKPFLRSPLDYAYISSHFNLKRKHPVLHKIRAHQGVDYAAPRGTPVRSSGDGKIIRRGRKGGYGNTVIIRHGDNYSTLYAHLSRFARGQRNGSRVKQGQVIGYVGTTGLSTGPHLHYEFRVNGVHKNPVTTKLPDAKPLPALEMARFRKAIQPLLAKLDLVNRAYAASAEP